MENIVEVGVGEVKLESENPIIALPKETELIIRAFWGSPNRCRVLYDRRGDVIYIVPEKENQPTEHISNIGTIRVTAVNIRLTLHEAIAVVIHANDNKPMRPSDILRKIKLYNLYKKRDGNYPGIHQIHARIHNYSELFKKAENGITLTEKGLEVAKKAVEKLGVPAIIIE
jgi:trehalose utilization protein